LQQVAPPHPGFPPPQGYPTPPPPGYPSPHPGYQAPPTIIIQNTQTGGGGGYGFNQVMEPSRSRVTMLLLCFFLGVFGAHRFYAGLTGSGIVMLILGFTFFGLSISGIWALIDFIIILCGGFRDSYGRII
jgi:TM2 domain-containing membrane protein YozV